MKSPLIYGLFTTSCLFWKHASAFGARASHLHCRVEPQPSSTTSSLRAAEDGKETLVFDARDSLTSGAVPKDRKEEFLDFFCRDEFPTRLFNAGGEREVCEFPCEGELESFWKETCQDWCPEMLPEEGDTILAAEASIRFPGLTLKIESYSGCKRGTAESGFPQIKFVTIAEKQSPEGLPPAVWVYNKLTGNQGKRQLPRGKAKSVICVREVEDSYALHYDVHLQINVVFPKILLRILPVSKEKAEKQGSEACAKTVSKEIEKAIAGAEQAFQKWSP